MAFEDLNGAVCALGVFDGFHSGHRHLVGASIDEARKRDARCIILTFDIDPDELFRGDAHMKLAEDDARIDSLASSGVDAVGIIEFDEALASMKPTEFLDRMFLGHVPAVLFVGEDFRFGRNASGDVDSLEDWGKRNGMEVKGISLLQDGDRPVTSTRIRDCLQDGNIEEAYRLLGHPYVITGIVVHGAGKGAEMGFQTANLKIPCSRNILREGVYAGVVNIDGRDYACAFSCGISPTFADKRDADMEVHIIGFSGDLYGKRIWVKPLQRLRPMIRFDDVDQLIATVKEDIAESERLAKPYVNR